MLIQVIISALTFGSIYGVIGLGYSLIYKASGLLNLAQGEFLMLGAFVGVTLYKFYNVPIILSILITAVVLFFVGMLTERFIIESLVKKGSGLAAVLLCTLALSMLFRNFAQLTWTTSVWSFPPIFKTATIKIGNTNIVPETFLIMGVAIVGMIGLHTFMNKTVFGTAMRASAMDDKASYAVGINVQLTKSITWGISAALAGAVGCVVGPIMSVYALMGQIISSKGFSGAVAGGYGNMYGAIIGGLLFGTLDAFIAAFISSVYRDLISFTVLIGILIFMPTGIFKADVIEQ